MEKRVSTRAIIIEDEKLVVLKRRKVKDNKIQEYYSLPGGGIEENETLEECVIREVKEELSVDVKIASYLGKQELDNSIEHVFSCKRVSGTYILGGEESIKNSENNHYEIVKLDLENLDNYDIFFKDKIRQVQNSI